MRLLVTTQAVDLEDAALAFFHEWLVRLARHYEVVEVICLKEGRHALPANVHIHSLGKEYGRAGKLLYALRFLRTLRRLHYDAVFVHMNPEYVVLAGLWWRLRGKRVVLWYTHRQVNLKLRIAAAFASAVVTAAPESLRLTSAKVHVIGHGIDTARFAASRDSSLHEPIEIVSVGRITPIKRLEILVEALGLLAAHGLQAHLTLVGEPVMEGDRAYASQLRTRAEAAGVAGSLIFAGSRPYAEMPAVYQASDILVNLAPTGGIDKVVLESMASGCAPFVANRAFVPLLGTDAERLMFEPSATDLASKIEAFAALSANERAALADRLAETAKREADLAGVIERLVALIAAP